MCVVVVVIVVVYRQVNRDGVDIRSRAFRPQSSRVTFICIYTPTITKSSGKFAAISDRGNILVPAGFRSMFGVNVVDVLLVADMAPVEAEAMVVVRAVLMVVVRMVVVIVAMVVVVGMMVKYMIFL